MSSFGFFQDYYSREFLPSSASSSIAFVGTLQMGLTNAMGALSGALCDRFGVKVRPSISLLASFSFDKEGRG